MRVSSQAMTSTPASVSQRAQGDVAEIADRGRHQMQAGAAFGAANDVARYGKGARAGSSRPSGVFIGAGFARIVPT